MDDHFNFFFFFFERDYSAVLNYIVHWVNRNFNYFRFKRHRDTNISVKFCLDRLIKKKKNNLIIHLRSCLIFYLGKKCVYLYLDKKRFSHLYLDQSKGVYFCVYPDGSSGLNTEIGCFKCQRIFNMWSGYEMDLRSKDQGYSYASHETSTRPRLSTAFRPCRPLDFKTVERLRRMNLINFVISSNAYIYKCRVFGVKQLQWPVLVRANIFGKPIFFITHRDRQE